MRRISHRQLRNNSGEVLRAVDSGESFEITNYGRVVALIVPAQQGSLAALRRSGKTLPATHSVKDLLLAPAQIAGTDSGDELDAMRADR